MNHALALIEVEILFCFEKGPSTPLRVTKQKDCNEKRETAPEKLRKDKNKKATSE